MPESSPRGPDTLRSIYYALGANVAITVVKFCGAAYTGSGALLAESLHSLADSGNQALLLLGRKQATAPATVRHPLGQGRATYFWAFIVTLLLFTLGGLFSIYEGYEKIRGDSEVESPWIAVIIVVIAAVLESISLRVTLEQIAGVRGDTSLFRWFRETRRGELIVVLGEDIAAVTGLAIALVALLATIVTGNAVYDGIGSVGVGALLIIVASGLGVEIKSLLIGESAAPRTRHAIRAFLENHPQVRRIQDLLTLQQQGDEIFIAAQLEMDPALGGRLPHAIAQCKADLRAQFPQAKWVYIEPVAPDDRRTDDGRSSRRRTRRPRRRGADPRASV